MRIRPPHPTWTICGHIKVSGPGVNTHCLKEGVYVRNYVTVSKERGLDTSPTVQSFYTPPSLILCFELETQVLLTGEADQRPATPTPARVGPEEPYAKRPPTYKEWFSMDGRPEIRIKHKSIKSTG